MEIMERFQADQDKSGEWFVFDDDHCYCCAGPMSESEAVELKIKLEAENENSKNNMHS